ncbi:MAG: class IV adenylate cyclase [Theionarchaea archaeon]|nr:class IV adenylate cyclase [Theionarchaea archaeon]MBU7000123.1 class IV adenylate cyclase [Theionarchaea archaeon]MBU7020840.1 class IV adenylate cyclase [Theionarchaea archaeon]MBU7033924.1 class IV adenylate cyclase [Theionarchaea archaeon]MBU7039220.1 class IV adenylate cyclase [Theionarchaea archaeon]
MKRVKRLEIEVKSRACTLEEVEERLLAMGGAFVDEVIQKDTYFNHPCKNFETTDEAVRIRVSNDRSYLTYKGKKVDPESKTRDEIEILIEDSEKGKEILKSLGFIEVAIVAKTRRVYSLDEFSVCLDTVDKLGTFVEVEGYLGGNPELVHCEKLRDKALNLLNELHLTDCERRSYLELLLEQEE